MEFRDEGFGFFFFFFVFFFFLVSGFGLIVVRGFSGLFGVVQGLMLFMVQGSLWFRVVYGAGLFQV